MPNFESVYCSVSAPCSEKESHIYILANFAPVYII